MKKGFLLFSPFLLFFLIAICYAGAFPKSHLLYPKAGASFKPGDRVTIRWKIVDANKAVFCEQEIFLIAGKAKYQISPELQRDIRKYEWIVPNIPTDNAYLELHLGCERGSAFEAGYIQKKHPFSIRPIQ